MRKGVKRLLAVVLSLSMTIATPIATPQKFTTAIKAEGQVSGSYVTDFSYDFAYTTPGYADGTFRMTATEDGTYKVYWGDAAGKKLAKNGYDFTQIATVVVQDGKGSYNLTNDYTAIPEGAENVLVYKKNQLQWVEKLPEEKLFKEEGDSYTFGSLSDPHFGRYSSVYDDDSVEAMEHAYEFYDDIGVDFVALSGDITSQGTQKELDKYNAVLANHPNITSLTTIGNHDSRTTVSTSDKSVLDTSLIRWYNSISSTYYTVDEDGKVNNNLGDNHPILANDALENPIITEYREAEGEEVKEKELPGMDFVTEAGGNIFIFFHEIAQTGEAFAMDKLITTGQMNWLEAQLDKYQNRNVFLYFHSFLPVNTLNGDVVDYGNCVGDLKNAGGYSYDFDFKDVVTTTTGLNMQGLLTKYSNVHMISGHSHWAYAMQDINPGLNIGRLAGGNGGTLAHMSSVGAPRIIGMNDESRTELNGYGSEGTAITVYDDCIVYNSIDFYKSEYEAYATYIIPAGENDTYEPVKNPDYKESDTAIVGDEYLEIEDMTTLQILQSDYNLTLGAAYVYSSKGGENKDGALTDGKSTGSYCNTKEGKNGDQYITITLDAEQDVSNLYYAYIYFVNGLTDSDSYNIQISQDGEHYETIGEYQEMTYKDTELELDISGVTLEKFKYVKLNLTGSKSRTYGYQIREFALIGYDRNQTPNTANSESHVDGTAPVDESEYINTDYNLVYAADYTQSSVGGEDKAGALTDGSLSGKLNTEWGSSAKAQEIIIDLGKGNLQDVSNIDYFLLYSQNNDTLVTAFNVYLSEDGESYEQVGSYSGVDLDTNHFDPNLTQVTFEKFRYVKLKLIDGKTNYGYQIKEFAVIAKEAVEYPPVEDQSDLVANGDKNIALGKTVYVSSIGTEGKDKTVLTDGQTNKFWDSERDKTRTSEYIVVDLGQTYDATLIGRTLINYQNNLTFCSDLRIEFSETFSEEEPTEGFYEVARTKASSWEALQRFADPNGYVQTKISDVDPGAVRYVKFQMNGHKDYGFQVKEVAIFLAEPSIENATITLNPKSYQYTGSEIVPNLTVTYGHTTLSEGADYDLVCTNNIEVGTATVEIHGKGIYTGVVTKTFRIIAKPMAEDDFNVEFSYNENNELVVTVKAGDYVLEEGKDYTYEIVENEDGSLTISFSAQGSSFTGSFEKTFEATELPANDAVNLSATSENLYEIKVSFENPSTYGASQQIYYIYVDDQLVDEGVPAGSYTYENQLIGTHQIKVVAKLGDSVTDGVTANVEVHGLDIETNVNITVEDAEFIFNGSAQKPEIIVSLLTDDESLLEEGVDYTVTYDNNVNAGTATYTVTGIGLYEGTVTGEFTIVPCDINRVTVDDSNLKQTMEYNGKARTPIISLYLGDYKLQPAKDYTVDYTDNLNAGTAHMIITATGENFTGTFTRDFTIAKKPLSKTTIKTTVNPDNTVTVKITNPEAGKTAIEGTDYTYTAVKDGKGNITVTIVASEVNYTGTYTKTLKEYEAQTTAQPTTTVNKVTVKKVKLDKPKNVKKKSIKVSWKKLSGVKGYQVRYATKKSMKKAKKKLIKKNKSTYTLKKLKLKKKYYIQVRAYKVVNGKKKYGKWSNKKKITIKK